MLEDEINGVCINSIGENNKVLSRVQMNGLGQPILGLKRTFLSDKSDHLYSLGPTEVQRSYLVGTLGNLSVKMSVVKWVDDDYIVITIKKNKNNFERGNKWTEEIKQINRSW